MAEGYKWNTWVWAYLEFCSRPSASPSPIVLSPNLPHPHMLSLSSSLPLCRSHPRVATPVGLMKSWSIVVPLDVKRRECRVVSRVIPTASLSFW